ncbi:unnamed protein product [Parascedosporium putredinis]|uniref:FAD-binding domain-containing protein n=1 Tax=Parascedosporium putredinis TaxID=1442378 RepID=A0A9P1GXD0_9PEZI|nr:unnamed protein product [Parascedosporium putredinis]CAI7989667.1 unnamed protein product [Parascedosporium putredinis]
MASHHFLEGKKIIVAGAGMAGLAFATALRKHWNPALPFPCLRIYERDTKVTAVGREGFSLSLAGQDETGGLYALMQLGLLDKILPHVILGLDGPGCFRVWDANFATTLRIKLNPAKGLPSAGIRIARKDLRGVLIEAGENDVVWDAVCLGAKKQENGKMLVTIRKGAAAGAEEIVEEECDLLLCADGANSKLRASLRPDDKLQYCGAVQLGGLARFEDGLPEPVGENWGMTTSGTGRAPITDRSSEEERRAVVEEGAKLGSMFSEPFPSIMRATDVDTVFAMPARDKQPFPHDLKGGPVVFLGDANHAVSPFAGYGASLALKDGWDLAEQICKASTLAQALQHYDKISIPRAQKSLDTAHGRIRDFHSTGIRFYFVKFMMTLAGFMFRLTGRG